MKNFIKVFIFSIIYMNLIIINTDNILATSYEQNSYYYNLGYQDGINSKSNNSSAYYTEGKSQLNKSLSKIKEQGKKDGLANSKNIKDFENEQQKIAYNEGFNEGYNEYVENLITKYSTKGAEDGKNGSIKEKLDSSLPPQVIEAYEQAYVSNFEQAKTEYYTLGFNSILKESENIDNISNEDFKNAYNLGQIDATNQIAIQKELAYSNGYSGKEYIVPENLKVLEAELLKLYKDGKDKAIQENEIYKFIKLFIKLYCIIFIISFIILIYIRFIHKKLYNFIKNIKPNFKQYIYNRKINKSRKKINSKPLKLKLNELYIKSKIYFDKLLNYLKECYNITKEKIKK